MSKQNVVWAVDVGSKEKRPIAAVAAVLRALFAKQWRVLPVYVAHSDELRFAKELREKGDRLGQLPVREKAVEAMKSVKGLDVSAVEILREKGVYLNSRVDVLVDCAKEKSAPFIVLTTHARKGLARFWLGSFAETMMLNSSVPLLLINPFVKPPEKYRTVFFPTDLSEKSYSLFQRVLDLASELGLRLVVYHRVESYHELTGMTIKPPVAFNAYRREVIRTRKEAIQRWVDEAAARGVQARIQISSTGDSLSEDVIERSAKMKDAVIALSPRTGSFVGAMVGSSARQIVRGASCPVWVLHERKAE